nr:MAG TPA: hypothetical protein [Caudoviricetes sp.]
MACKNTCSILVNRLKPKEGLDRDSFMNCND